MKNVLVIGLGEIGRATAKYYREHGCTVWGWDIDYKARMIAEETLDVIVYKKFENYGLDVMDVVTVCVTTDAVNDVAEQFIEHYETMNMSRPLLFIIESTVKPGTCRKIWDKLFGRRLGIAHVPQRFWGADPLNRGIRRVRVMSASDGDTLAEVINFMFYVKMPFYTVNSLEIAELGKIAENAYRYVLIAYAEELWNVCKEHRIDFWEVKEAIESHKWLGYVLEPREGIGGQCLPMAADVMNELSDFNDIIQAAKKADRRYRDENKFE